MLNSRREPQEKGENAKKKKRGGGKKGGEKSLLGPVASFPAAEGVGKGGLGGKKGEIGGRKEVFQRAALSSAASVLLDQTHKATRGEEKKKKVGKKKKNKRRKGEKKGSPPSQRPVSGKPGMGSIMKSCSGTGKRGKRERNLPKKEGGGEKEGGGARLLLQYSESPEPARSRKRRREREKKIARKKGEKKGEKADAEMVGLERPGETRG